MLILLAALWLFWRRRRSMQALPAHPMRSDRAMDIFGKLIVVLLCATFMRVSCDSISDCSTTQAEAYVAAGAGASGAIQAGWGVFADIWRDVFDIIIVAVVII